MSITVLLCSHEAANKVVYIVHKDCRHDDIRVRRLFGL